MSEQVPLTLNKFWCEAHLYCEHISCLVQEMCTTSKCLVRHSNSDIDCFVHIVVIFLHKSFWETRQSELPDNILPNFLSKPIIISLEKLTFHAESLRPRNPLWQSELLLCSGEIQRFGDDQRIHSFLWFAPSPCRMLHKRTSSHQFAQFTILMQRTLKLMPGSTSISFWTIILLKTKHVGWFSFHERFCPDGVPLSKQHLRGDIDGRELLPFPLDSRFCSGWCFMFCLCPWTCPWVHAAGLERGLLILSCSRREMFPTSVQLQVSDRDLLESGAFSRFTFMNKILCVQRQQWVEMFSLKKMKKIQILVWLLFQHDYCFIPSRVGRQYVVILQFGLPNFIEVQDGFVRVADLGIQADHPCDLQSRNKALSFVQLLPEVSVDDLLETTCWLRIKNLEVCLQLGPSGRTRRLQIGNGLRGFNFNRTACTRGFFSLLTFIRQIPKFMETSLASNSNLSTSMFKEFVSLSIVLAPPPEH